MTEYHHIVNVEGAILKDNRLLMVIRSDEEEHAGGLLSFIGGKVEFADVADRVIIETLKREILEEVAVTVTNCRFVTSTGFTTDAGETVVNLVFLCDWLAGDPAIVDSREVASLAWMRLDEIRQHQKAPPWLFPYLDCIESIIEANHS